MKCYHNDVHFISFFRYFEKMAPFGRGGGGGFGGGRGGGFRGGRGGFGGGRGRGGGRGESMELEYSVNSNNSLRAKVVPFSWNC